LPSPVFPSYLSYRSPRASVGAERCQKMVFPAAIREKSRCWVAFSYDAHSVSAGLGRIRQPCFRLLSDWILVRTFLKHSPFLRGKQSLFAIWSSSPQRFHSYFFLSIVSWQYQKYSTILILVLCLLYVTPLICSSYSSFAPSSPFFSS